MTPLAWIFMLLSVTFVTALVAWCFYKVLTASPQDKVVAPPESLGG
jgi:hypothetical protein